MASQEYNTKENERKGVKKEKKKSNFFYSTKHILFNVQLNKP